MAQLEAVSKKQRHKEPPNSSGEVLRNNVVNAGGTSSQYIPSTYRAKDNQQQSGYLKNKYTLKDKDQGKAHLSKYMAPPRGIGLPPQVPG